MKYKVILKNSIMLYGMTFAKMVFPLLTLPYLTRVLSVEMYGSVAYVKSMMSFLQVIVDFGFMLSGTKEIVENRNDKERLSTITSDIMAARIFIALFCLAGVFICTKFLPVLKGLEVYTVLSFGTVFLSIFLFDYLFRGMEKMEVITVRYILMRGIATLLTFVAVRNDSDVLFIPILDLIGSCVAVGLVLKKMRDIGVRIRILNLKNVFWEVKLSFVYFVSNMATTLFTAINTLIIGVALSSKEIAYWSVCMQMVNSVQALYTPITDAIYPEMLKSRSLKLIKKVSILFFPILLAGCIFTYFAAPVVIQIVAGKQYGGAYEILRLLIPVLFFGFYSILYGWPTLGSIKKEKCVMAATICSAVFQLIGFFILIVGNSFTLAFVAILRGMTEIVLFGIRFYFFVRYRKSFNRS